MLWIDIKYSNLIGSRLDLFKIKSTNPYKSNFRCPYCGDSRKNKYKTRGWLFEDKSSIYYKCFNCGKSSALSTFLKDVDYTLFSEYRLESFDKPKKDPEVVIENPKPIFETSLSGLVKVTSLPTGHPARLYLESRQVTADSMSKIYYVDSFFTWVNTIIPGKFSDLHIKTDEPRIVFPLIVGEKLIGVNARCMPDSKATRYITIKFDETAPKLFGLDDIDLSKKIICVEGPLDSLFLDNAIAMVGADINLEQYVNKTNTILLFDNEPRNKEITDRMNKYLSNGWELFIWPSNIKQKDINDCVLSGYTPEYLQSLILERAYSGARGLLEFNTWKK